MKPAMVFVLGVAVGAGAALLPKLARHIHEHLHGGRQENAPETAGAVAHTEEKFEFEANGTMEEVAPLFGAEKERVWAPDWNPRFVWPAEAADREGMVFTVAHGHMKSVWVNTALDFSGGRIQYAYVIPGAMATVITIRLTPEGERTHVAVKYDRTALSADLNGHVEEMAEEDAKSGPYWEKQINEYLSKPKQ